MEGWLAPADWPVFLRAGVLAAAAVIVIAGLVALHTRRRWRGVAIGPYCLVFTFFFAYTAVLILTRDFLDAGMPFDDRLFAPIQPLIYILLISSLWLLLANRGGTQDRRVVNAYLGVKGPRVESEALVCVAVSLLIAVPALHTTIDSVVSGVDRPRESPTLAAVGQLPQSVFVATNAGDALWFETGRASIGVPSLADGTTQEKNPRFLSQLTELAAEVTAHHGVIALLTPSLYFTVTLTVANANHFAYAFHRSLHVLLRFKDGVIMGRRDTVAYLASQPPHIRLRD
jgi:hypothetical protein